MEQKRKETHFKLLLGSHLFAACSLSQAARRIQINERALFSINFIEKGAAFLGKKECEEKQRNRKELHSEHSELFSEEEFNSEK